MAQKLSSGIDELSLDESYLIVAAIDFGTTFSGYAFSFKSSKDDIKMNKNWGAVVGCESYQAPTCVMTNPDGSFHSFGYTAEHEYSQLDPDEDEIGGPTGYNLYRHFKMLLHGQGVTLGSNVASTTGHITKAIDIFTMVLKYLHGHMVEPIEKANETPPKASDIRWVLTVPAIWTDESKAFMREAAYRAGLIPEKNSNQLLLALEPEAASTFCRFLGNEPFQCSRKTQDVRFSYRTGQKLIIIDAGGGTVDIVVHELLINGKFKEICPPSGGSWGGIKVEAGFVSILEKTFGTDFIDKFKLKYPQQWLDFMTKFEKSKKSFIPTGKCSLKASPPYSFENELKKYGKRDVEACVKKLGDPNITFNNGYIIIKHEKAKNLFAEQISHITCHVKTLMSDSKLDKLDYIILVGGFGDCKMLQEACEKEFSHFAKILIPMEAQLAVIKGAVLFGHDPLQIHSRIARFTYGKKVLYHFDEKQHDISKKKTYNSIDWCDDCFEIFISKDEEITVGSVKTFTTMPAEPDQTGMTFKFYRTEKTNVMYVDEPGLTQVATAKLSSSSGPLSNNVEIRVTFGHTEMLVEARDADKEKQYQMKVTLDFLCN